MGNDSLGKIRKLMQERGYDGVIMRNVSDLRWVLNAQRVFDDERAHVALILPEQAFLHTDSRYCGAIEAQVDSGAWKVDQEAIQPVEWVAQSIKRHRLRVVAVEDSVSLGWYERLKWELNRSSVSCLLPRMHDDVLHMRVVKDDQELQMLRQAQRVTDEAFVHMLDFVQAGITELAIRAELESYMLSHGADALAFDSIIASGPNGANPHARPGNRCVESGDLIVMDYGASVADYRSDMTRTICVGTPSDDQRRAYDAVRRANEECEQLARPGMLGKDLHAHAVRVLEEAGYGQYFRHGLGHGVGIDIHELPVVGVRGDKPLVEGSVFTVEPGVYLPHEFGIRLEDCGVMGSEGYEPFTQSTHELMCV